MGVVIKWPFTGRAEGGSGEPWTIFPGSTGTEKTQDFGTWPVLYHTTFPRTFWSILPLSALILKGISVNKL